MASTRRVCNCRTGEVSSVPLDAARLAYRHGLAAREVEQAWAEFRQERNARLAASDFVFLPDSPVSSAYLAEWHVYRQALRDLPAVTADPRNPEWPEAPDGPS